MNEDILISVILPVYNGEDHLTECIESVLKQSHKNFEFIIVDDASTDSTPKILSQFATVDDRIKIITHDVNKKQTTAANTAIKNTMGKYLARMDADDVALPNRFKKQLNFLEENPRIGLLGSWVDIIDDDGNIIKIWETIPTNGYLGWNLLFGTSFAHSSVMMRKSIAQQAGLYQSAEAEDYDLWSRISRISSVANIPEVLQQKRVWAGQLALKVPTETRNCVIEIMQNNINYLSDNANYDLEIVRKIRSVSDKTPVIENSETISHVRIILIELYKEYLSKNIPKKLEKKLISRNLFQKLDTLTEWQKLVNKRKSFKEISYLAFNFPKLYIQKFITKNR